MSKKINNSNLPKEIVKGLKGFEDVFEDYVESENYKDQERRDSERLKSGEQHELQYFLEKENARLTKLEIFLTQKISLKTNFSQTDKLVLLQKEKKKELREKLSKELRKPESPFQKNLADFFNSHFG